MLSYLIAGLAVGAVYAISSLALVITYNASRVFNFAQGGMAFFVAYCFYWLYSSVGLPVWLAAVVAVLVVAPLLGFFLWWVLLGKLSDMAPLTKVAATIGLQVALTAVTTLIFGNGIVADPRGIVGQPQPMFTVAGVVVTNEQFVVIVAAALVAAGGYFVLNRTTAGLVTRGAVDSSLNTELSGTNPRAVIAVTWVVATAVAGLAGIMVLPKVGLTATGFSTLIAASFAGAVIGKFTNLWRAFFGALVVGVVQEMAVPLLPDEGLLATALRPSLPFLFMVGAVLIYSRSRDVRAAAQQVEVASAANAADKALTHYLHVMRDARGQWDRWVGWGLLLAVLIAIPLVLNKYWLGLVALGFAYSVAFLSYRLVTGEAGIIGLCQISFAGIGAIAASQFATNLGWPVLWSLVLGAAVAGVCGTVVGLICLPLGPLYAAITTFAFALLVDQAVYTRPEFSNYGSGLPLARPSVFGFAITTSLSFYWFAVIVFFLVASVLWSLRRSNTGMVFAAIRASRVRAVTLGFEIYIARVGVFALGAAVAGLGGALIGSYALVAYPNSYLQAVGLVWFALAVAQGTSSIGGAAAAGLSYILAPAIFAQFLPERLADVPILLFGLVAINMVVDPIGINPSLRARFRSLAIRISSMRKPPDRGNDDTTNVPATLTAGA